MHQLLWKCNQYLYYYISRLILIIITDMHTIFGISTSNSLIINQVYAGDDQTYSRQLKKYRCFWVSQTIPLSVNTLW